MERAGEERTKKKRGKCRNTQNLRTKEGSVCCLQGREREVNALREMAGPIFISTSTHMRTHTRNT